MQAFFDKFDDFDVRAALLATLKKTEKIAFGDPYSSETVFFHSQPFDLKRLGLTDPRLPKVIEEFGVTLFSLESSGRKKQLFTRVTLLPDHMIALGAQYFIKQGRPTELVFDHDFGEYHSSGNSGGLKVSDNLFDASEQNPMKAMTPEAIIRKYVRSIRLYNYINMVLPDQFVQRYTAQDFEAIQQGLIRFLNKNSRPKGW